jgi:hypothetical protein
VAKNGDYYFKWSNKILNLWSGLNKKWLKFWKVF